MIERAVDRYNQEILRQVVSYTACCFTPQKRLVSFTGFRTLEEAAERAVKVLQEDPSTRAVMLYAVDHHDRHVMVGHYDRSLRYRQVHN